MSFGDWSRKEHDPGTVEDTPCPVCGVLEDEDCAEWCDCYHCNRRREREKLRELEMVE